MASLPLPRDLWMWNILERLNNADLYCLALVDKGTRALVVGCVREVLALGLTLIQTQGYERCIIHYAPLSFLILHQLSRGEAFLAVCSPAQALDLDDWIFRKVWERIDTIGPWLGAMPLHLAEPIVTRAMRLGVQPETVYAAVVQTDHVALLPGVTTHRIRLEIRLEGYITMAICRNRVAMFQHLSLLAPADWNDDYHRHRYLAIAVRVSDEMTRAVLAQWPATPSTLQYLLLSPDGRERLARILGDDALASHIRVLSNDRVVVPPLFTWNPTGPWEDARQARALRPPETTGFSPSDLLYVQAMSTY